MNGKLRILVVGLLAAGWALTTYRLSDGNRRLRTKLRQAEARLAAQPPPVERETPDAPDWWEAEVRKRRAGRRPPPESAVSRKLLEGAPKPPYGSMLLRAQEDLDGDGRPEHIELNPDPGEDAQGFTLTVNKMARIRAEIGPWGPEGFYIVDVDRDDALKEVAVYAQTDSDLEQHMLSWYDGTRLREMGVFEPFAPTCLGNGVVLAHGLPEWAGDEVHQFVESRDRELVEVPQEFLYVGVVAEVEEECALLQRNNSSAVVEKLEPGRRVALLLYAGEPYRPATEWYLAVSDYGLVGWLSRKELNRLGGWDRLLP